MKKKELKVREIKNIENLMVEKFNWVGFGYASDEAKEDLLILESRRRKILLHHEHDLRLKI